MEEEDLVLSVWQVKTKSSFFFYIYLPIQDGGFSNTCTICSLLMLTCLFGKSHPFGGLRHVKAFKTIFCLVLLVLWRNRRVHTDRT